MSQQPFNIGGYIKGGRVLVAPAGTEPVLTLGQWTVLGQFANLRPDDASPTINRSTRTLHRSMTFQQLPPQTRREKRQRNAFMRLMYGRNPPPPRQRRPIIHNGGKP